MCFSLTMHYLRFSHPVSVLTIYLFTQCVFFIIFLSKTSSVEEFRIILDLLCV